ncbi:Na(+)-translocating NADH-quinone reductase subunit C [Limihaloglobus sulfuriphilus]|uniref:Na(+)-translocating NADH-quinone reductase subunit C n=1 Tax=Limihaloglobus sulfuriphilus TaxID=1851148 RepID=A0A1Q2MB69_9BACT|nr:FMN-binding protein [Limihaloglobus sulfuriphilus]AQQ69936.1 Na(+)-translocating NADH-quinone reductase subunit C [Limihaloglobus sulfuriphilus]
MIADKKWFPVLYMFVITALCSSVLIGFTRVTSERVDANQLLAFEKAVLEVLPGVYEQGQNASGVDVHKMFTEKVTEPDESSAGAYTLREDGKIAAYALPVSGQGFWAPIDAIIGIAADAETITGIAIYEQNETPGLGAEITKPQFKSQFDGKVLLEGDKPLSIKRPGSELDDSSVHAVTGATQTSVRFEKIINDGVKKWRQEMGTIK